MVEVSGPTGNWDNVSWDYPEALENGPSINGDRIMRIVDPSHYDGELAERDIPNALSTDPGQVATSLVSIR